MINEDGFDNSGREHKESSSENRRRSHNRHYRHEQSSVISEVTCVDSSKVGNTECISYLSSQETITKSFTSGSDGPSFKKSDSNHSEDRVLNSPVESTRDSHMVHSNSDSKPHFLDGSYEFGFEDSKQGGRDRNLQSGMLHYNRRSKRDKKLRQGVSESTPSVSRASSRVIDPIEASRHGASSSECYTNKDESIHSQRERGIGGYHRRERSPCESRHSSRKEKSSDRFEKEKGGNIHHQKQRSPVENRHNHRLDRPGEHKKNNHLENQERSGEARRDNSSDHLGQSERGSYLSVHSIRDTSHGETKHMFRQEDSYDQRMLDSDGSTFQSVHTVKSRLDSQGKDIASGIGDSAIGNSSDEVVAADARQHIEDSSIEAKTTILNSEGHIIHFQAQPVITLEEELWQEDMDVPMDISPAPAEDNASSSQVTCLKSGDSRLNEHFVHAEIPFHEDPDGRGWVYFDREGVLRGPSSLFVLKSLVKEGKMQPDHMVQLDGTDIWVTVEHAGLVPEAIGETLILQIPMISAVQCNFQPYSPHLADDSTINPGPMEQEFVASDCGCLEDLHIDDRVDKFMQGFSLVPGKEKETIVEALTNVSSCNYLETELEFENEDDLYFHANIAADWSNGQPDFKKCFNQVGNISEESAGTFTAEILDHSAFQSSQSWTSGGGDWKLMLQGESASVKSSQNTGRPEKKVLNHGMPLCGTVHDGLVDPRIGSVLYDVPNSRMLELPFWAYRYWESSSAGMTTPSYMPTSKSQVGKSKESSTFDNLKNQKIEKANSSSEQKMEEVSTPGLCETSLVQSKAPFSSGFSEKDDISTSLMIQDLECINPQPERQDIELVMAENVTEEKIDSVQQVLTRQELMLELGEWFYQDGSGQEIGPYTFSELQSRVNDGLIYEGSSVYRKSDETWVPLFGKFSSRSRLNSYKHNLQQVPGHELVDKEQKTLLDFHDIHPQFIGFMCGRLHEHVMKSYKTRDFAAMVDEGSRKCFAEKSSRKTTTADGLSTRLESDSKQKDNCSSDRVSPLSNLNLGLEWSKSISEFEDGTTTTGTESRGWNLMDPQILLKIFSFLIMDLKSLCMAALTCKSWKAALSKFKSEITEIDLSSIGSCCSDAMFRFMTEHAQNVSHINLRGCINLSPTAVKDFLESSCSIESIDFKGCEQLKELAQNFCSQRQPSHSDHKLKGVKSSGDRRGMFSGRHSHFSDTVTGKKLSFTSEHADNGIEPMDCDMSHYFQEKSDGNHGVSAHDFKRQKLESTGKMIKAGPDSYYSKSMYRDKEHYDSKHKQSSKVSARVNEAIARVSFRGESIEKDMSLILQCVKDLKIPFKKEVASARCRVELTKVEEKLGRGFYSGTSNGVRAFKSELFDVARKLFRLKEFDAGNDIFTMTFCLSKQLLHELKNRDVIDSSPFRRKFEGLKSTSSLSSRKRGIGNVIREQVIGKRRKVHDEISEDESEYNYLSKSETSGTDGEDDYLSQGDKDDDSVISESEVESDSEGERKVVIERERFSDDETENRFWGARMTKASMVPPETRKYELIEEYVVVADTDEVEKRMSVNLPKDYDKMMQAQEDKGIEYSHLEMPELREFKPRKHVSEEVIEQEVYGIDPYTHNLLLDSMPTHRLDFSDSMKHQLIEDDILKALNQEARQFTGSGKAPTKYPLENAVQRALEECKDPAKKSFIAALMKNIKIRKDSHMKDTYFAYRKGLGVVCNHASGFDKDEFIVEFFGEVYPAWRWFEKQDAIRFFQKKDKEPAPEFYNIFLERPKGDASGYDLVVVDAMHKANYASRICHSCRPNCEARVTAVNGRYQIGVYTLRPVEYGEELTFDYNSITESKEEHEKSICLCGSHICRGSYLNFAGPETFQEIMKEGHSVLHRYDLLLRACIDDSLMPGDWDVLKQAGLGSCLLDGLPEWTIKYAVGVVRFINEEKKFLPREILKNIVNERKLERAGESEALEAEIQADGVFNTRLQNLAITLDKVRYAFKRIYGNPSLAPPPLRMLKPADVVGLIWKHDNSVVADLLAGVSQFISKEDLQEFKCRLREHEPSQEGNIEKSLQQSLLWLRDELCKAPLSSVCRHDGAADLIHMYAYTKLFFTPQAYPTFDSPPLTISPLDLGPKYAHKLGGASSLMEWKKTYGKDYILGQLIFWNKPNVDDPGAGLLKASKGCLILPDPMSCYAKPGHQHLVYGSMDRLQMLRRMEHKPSRSWTWKGQLFWEFNKNINRQLFGSPMMDSIHQGTVVSQEMVDWLKKRTRTIQLPL
ncbi:hypothetical protein KP509_18G017200 [Ceratopteris richardii]|nr:hypothetical protein KP509_18G017200 [Ceratopteris richardii]